MFEISLEDNKFGNMYRILDGLGIKCDDIEIEKGEIFDRYDLKLNPKTKISKVERSLQDIGLHMCAQSAPRGFVSMKNGTYRIEIQKRELPKSTFDDLFSKSNNRDGVLLGRFSDGDVFTKRLNTLPNLLIAGVPGSGKSILLHSLVLSLIANNAKIYLVDPKMVEFNIYSDVGQVRGFGHSVEDTYEIIKEVEELMNDRFELLRDNNCRNFGEYNGLNKSEMRPVVILIDEWADIVLHDKNIQKSLCVVAQKGRAAGISVVLATQRPSASVISGLIKANFPGRIALRVTTKLESRIVLDQHGAETIVDVGTGLYIDHLSAKPTLFRAPWIEDPSKTLKEVLKTYKEKTTFWQRMWTWDL